MGVVQPFILPTHATTKRPADGISVATVVDGGVDIFASLEGRFKRALPVIRWLVVEPEGNSNAEDGSFVVPTPVKMICISSA